MKKLVILIEIFIFFVLSINGTIIPNTKDMEIDTITIGFAPTVDPEKIIAGTHNLETLLIDELKKLGVSVNNINISVMTSYDAAAESLLSGSNLIAFMPTTTFAIAQTDDIEPFLEGLRLAQNANSTLPKDWNNNLPNVYIEGEYSAVFYSLIVLGPSVYGKILKELYIKNGKLTWDELNTANICFGSNPTSSATFIYPSMWLYDNFNKIFNDIEHVIPSNNSTEMTANLAMKVCDVAPISSMSRVRYENDWQEEWERSESIWVETYVIGVSEPITNGMFGISKVNENYSEILKEKLIQAFLNIANMNDGKEIFNSINLEGVSEVSDNYLESTYASIDFMREILK